MDGWMDGWIMDGWVDGQMDVAYMFAYKKKFRRRGFEICDRGKDGVKIY